MKKRFTLAAILVAVLVAFGAFMAMANDDSRENNEDNADVTEFTFTGVFNVMDDYDAPGVDFRMISADGELIIHITDDVDVYFEGYVPLGDETDEETRNAREVLFGRTLAEVLENRNLKITYSISTRSIPPQTTPTMVEILFETAVHLPIEIGDIENNLPFEDVVDYDWFYNSVVWAFEHGFMSGVSDSEFAPSDEMTRAMLVTVLWRYAGQPGAGEAGFVDVAENAWYGTAVAWAAQSGIVNGITDTEFAPHDNINREQMYSILYRYMRFAGLMVELDDEMRLSRFDDHDSISEWAVDAMYFMHDAGIMFMYSAPANSAVPQEMALRAEIAAAMYFFDMYSMPEAHIFIEN